MNRPARLVTGIVFLLSAISYAQLDRIVIPAGTPEDTALTEIGKEQDAQKKTAMYEDFLQKFSANPAAVAYGNWQLSQAYQSTGDLNKALEYGDKAVKGSPHNLDILVSQASIAQQLKDDGKVIEYSALGGEAYNSIAKQPRSEGLSDQEFAARVEQDKSSAKNSYDFLEAAGFNAITDEKDPKARMSHIERYTAAFPDTKFGDQVAQYAMYTLGPGQLNDPTRLVAFGDKALAANPNSIPALILLSNFFVDDSKPGSVTKAASYAQKVIELAKADAPDADKSRKLSAGVAHSTLGYALMKQEKTAAAVPQLKSATELLKGQDDTAYAAALYRLGYAYAKLNKISEARETLQEAVKIQGPIQQPAQELLTKVNSARAKAK
jgi:tetratricopeptide (TPR) repeat protein